MTGRGKMKKKRIINRIGKLLLVVVIFLFLLVIESARWFLTKFEGLDISVAIYQLLSPLKGTSSSVVWEYCKACLFPALFLAVLIAFLYQCFDAVTDRLYLDVHIRVYHRLTDSYRNFNLYFRKKFRKISKILFSLVLITGISVTLVSMAFKVGLPGYLRNVTTTSQIIEEYYVDPDDIEIVFPEEKRNLIILYMESLENTFASEEAGGGEPVNYISELTYLAEQGVNFSDTELLGGAYGLSGAGWTIAALLAYQTGVTYKLPVESTADYEEFLPGLKGMGEVLAENGYSNYFMCGSDTTFGGRRNLFEHHGDYVIYDWLTAKDEGFIPQDYDVFWGMEDAKLYEYAKMHLEEIGTSGDPFCFTMLTVDTHFPNGYLCGLCGDEYEEQYANVVSCASRQALGFVEWIEVQDWFEDTTVVIVGDHLTMNEEFFDDIEPFDRRIYNCFYNLPEGLPTSRSKGRNFNTTDLCPTILAAIGVGIEGERFGIGTNLFSDRPTLQEELDMEGDELNNELNRYSTFYFDRFVIGKDE